MHRILAVSLLFATVAHADPDERYVASIRAAAAAYKQWARVDGRPNIAPVLCRSPLPADWGEPSHVRMSAAGDSAHGRKLYYLWANDKAIYVDRERILPVGFSIVKESFEAVPSNAVHKPRDPRMNRMGEPPPVDWMITDTGEQLATGARKDLFVMTKIGDLPGSDAGWIYGTVTVDGTVTSAGRVASCMGCHVERARRERLFHVERARRERLFGLRPAPRS